MGSEAWSKLKGLGTFHMKVEGEPTVKACPKCEEFDALKCSSIETITGDPPIDYNTYSCTRCEYSWKQVSYL